MRAERAARAKSQFRSSSRPPAAATPFTSATAGTGKRAQPAEDPVQLGDEAREPLAVALERLVADQVAARPRTPGRRRSRARRAPTGRRRRRRARRRARRASASRSALSWSGRLSTSVDRHVVGALHGVAPGEQRVGFGRGHARSSRRRRISCFWILPDAVVGSSVEHLEPLRELVRGDAGVAQPRRPRSRGRERRPDASTTHAHTTSPSRSSGGADDRDRRHLGEPADQVLELAWRDVHAAPDDELLLAADDGEVAVGRRAWRGRPSAPSRRRRRSRRCAPDRRRSRRTCSGPRTKISAVAQLDLDAAHRARRRCARVRRAERPGGSRSRPAPRSSRRAAARWTPCVVALLDQRRRHRCAAAPEAAERVDRCAATCRLRHQLAQERRRRQGVRAPLTPHEVDRHRRIPPVLQHQGQPVVEREPQAVVEPGAVAERRRHPHHVVAGDLQIAWRRRAR